MSSQAETTLAPLHAPKPGASALSVILAPGITRTNLTALLFCGIAAFSLSSFVNLLQPYLLTEHLALAKDVQGRLSGRLSAMQETVALVLAGFIGIASDTIGRNRIFALGLLLVAGGLVAMPLAESVLGLYGGRFILALGSACIAATFNGLVADTPDNRSRGRLLLLLGVTQQAFILLLVFNGAARLPQLLRALGVGPIASGRAMFWMAATVALVGAIIAFRGLPRVAASAIRAKAVPVREAIRAVLADARQNRRLMLVFPAAIVARGDVAIASLFLPLWIVVAGSAKGIATAQALAWSGTAFSVMSVTGFAGTLIGGWLADRLDRVLIVRIGFACGAVAYLASLALQDVYGGATLIFAGAVGFSEMMAITAGQALLGETAPPERRGAVAGLFSVTGSTVVLTSTWLAGELFDHLGPSAPFVMMGLINVVLLAVALTVPIRSRR